MAKDTVDPNLVRTSSLGDELDKSDCEALAKVMGFKRLRDGETLVSEGGADSSLFVLADGKLAVLSMVEGKEAVVYTMSKGECAGTRAFVDRAPRRATLRAEGDAVVYTLEPKKFEAMLDDHPRIVYKIMRALFRITHANLMRMNVESRELANYITKTHGRY